MKKIKSRKKGRLLKKIYALTVLIAGVMILILSMLLLFHTKEIKVTGTQYSSAKETEEWLRNDRWSVNTLYLFVRYNYIDQDLLPFMEDMKVSLNSPWSVTIHITEKKRIGYIQNEQGNICFDKEGRIVCITSEPLTDLPLIEGMEIQKASLYEVLEVKDEKVFGRILEATQVLKKCDLVPDRIICDGKNITLYFKGICAELGSSELKNKILQLSEILEKLEGQEGTLQMQHFTANSKYISFRKRQETDDTIVADTDEDSDID